MGTSLTVDRSELADTAQADVLASLLIKQIAPQLEKLLPLPLEEVARACGIVEIQPLETDGFEGGLIQDEYKERGFILVKAGRLPQRTRFTIAHELGHFVNLRHVAPVGSEQLLCSKQDFREDRPTAGGRHGMEAQANEFAACLLMPREHIAHQPWMTCSPEMASIMKLHSLCDVSKEAAARRYKELHGGDFAVVFSKDGKLIYPLRSGDFPWLDVQRGQELFRKTATRTFIGEDGDVSDQEETDSSWWLGSADAERWELWEEVLVQKDGYRMTLLLGERLEEGD
jgi:hypothetical protein